MLSSGSGAAHNSKVECTAENTRLLPGHRAIVLGADRHKTDINQGPAGTWRPLQPVVGRAVVLDRQDTLSLRVSERQPSRPSAFGCSTVVYRRPDATVAPDRTPPD
jgi:hypothetical protein